MSVEVATHANTHRAVLVRIGSILCPQADVQICARAMRGAISGYSPLLNSSSTPSRRLMLGAESYIVQCDGQNGDRTPTLRLDTPPLKVKGAAVRLDTN